MTTLALTHGILDNGIFRTLADIGRLFGSIAAAQRATADFERMSRQTDAQLAAKGLERAEIARVVFNRHFR